MTTHPTSESDPGTGARLVRLKRLPRHSEPPAPAAKDSPGHVGPPVVEQRPTLTVAEAATLLGVSRWLVEQQMSCGVLPAVRLGRRILIPRARLLAWLESEREDRR